LEGSSVPVFFIAHGTVKNPEKMQKYVELSGPIVARHGGEWLTTGEVKAVLTGHHTHVRTAIFRFPSLEDAQGWFNDPEYKKLCDLRAEAGDFDFLLVEEYPWVAAAKAAS
jgi:uncharacterized protein (DUF1330 family)